MRVALRVRASRTDVLAHVPADGTLDALHVAVATHVTDRVAFPLRPTHGVRWRPRLREELELVGGRACSRAGRHVGWHSSGRKLPTLDDT